jgi:hypothetical protein
MLGRSKASPAVLAAATGRSSNPLLQHNPSMPRFPSMASLPSFSSGSFQELAGNSHYLQETLAGDGEHLPQQLLQQDMAHEAWHAVAQPQQQQQQQQQQEGRPTGLLRQLLRLLWRCMFAPLLPFTWLWTATLGRLRRSSKPQLQLQQQGLEYAYAQAYQPEAAAEVLMAAAGAPAAARQLRRSIVFEQPSGFGVHERSKRRGLLEVTRLYYQQLCSTIV